MVHNAIVIGRFKAEGVGTGLTETQRRRNCLFTVDTPVLIHLYLKMEVLDSSRTGHSPRAGSHDGRRIEWTS